MADKEKRSLREFLRHINDYTYRFNPEKKGAKPEMQVGNEMNRLFGLKE